MRVPSAAASEGEGDLVNGGLGDQGNGGLVLKSIKKISIFILLLLLASYAVPASAATYYFGGAKKTLSLNSVTVEAGYYDATTLTAVATQLAAGNIKSGTTIFGITGTLSGGGTNYGLPKTSQQPGYPSGTPFYAGDDASYANPAGSDISYPRGKGSWANYNATRFTTSEPVAGQVVVTDNATGLMWEQKTAGGSGGLHDMDNTYTWADAFDTFIAGVNSENFAGHNDWRLPNCFELESILDLGRSTNPSINPIFVNIVSAPYWSSTTYAPSTDCAWRVDFSSGIVDYNIKDGKFSDISTRAVRGGGL